MRHQNVSTGLVSAIARRIGGSWSLRRSSPKHPNWLNAKETQFGPKLHRGRQAAWYDAGGMWISCAQVRHIRALAKRNHDDALPKLQRRIAKLGSDIKETDLWMTLLV